MLVEQKKKQVDRVWVVSDYPFDIKGFTLTCKLWRWWLRSPEASLPMFKTDWIEFKHFDIIFISSFRHKTHPKSSVWNDVSGKELEVTHHHRKVQQGRRYMPTVMNGKTCRRKKKLFVTDWIQWKSEKKWFFMKYQQINHKKWHYNTVMGCNKDDYGWGHYNPLLLFFFWLCGSLSLSKTVSNSFDKPLEMKREYLLHICIAKIYMTFTMISWIMWQMYLGFQEIMPVSPNSFVQWLFYVFVAPSCGGFFHCKCISAP